MRSASPDRGSVTAELAVGSVSVVLLLLLLLCAAVVGAAAVRVQLAAGTGARGLARGDPADDVEARVASLAGPGALVTASTPDGLGGGTDPGPGDGPDGWSDGWSGDAVVRLDVVRPVVLLLPGRPVVRVRGSASALAEEP